MLFQLSLNVAKLLLIVACLYLALRTYVHHQRPNWSASVRRQHLSILLVLALAVSSIKLIEDVLGGESAIVDEAILQFVHSRVPGALTGLFEAITFTGSFSFLFPLTTVVAIALLLARRRSDALLLIASVLSSVIVVYLLKRAVGRNRPALWDVQWYWGSSFPSGHTLVVAAFAVSVVLCVSRIWPAARSFTVAAAVCWICLVALSRLVLGVHWPTDVLAAACIGAILPLTISVGLELRRA